MTEIVDLKTRRKTKAPVDEPEVTVADFLRGELADVEKQVDDKPAGAILILFSDTGEFGISHINASWQQILWYAWMLASYATSDEEEDDED